MDRLKVIKVKRKFKEEDVPDLLLLDTHGKRSKTSIRLYERIKTLDDDLIGHIEEYPLASIERSITEVLDSLTGTIIITLYQCDPVVKKEGDELEMSSELSEDQYDFYQMQEDEDLLREIDLTELYISFFIG